MLLFNWSKVYNRAGGNILMCNLIMSMLTKKTLPANKRDPLYKFSTVNFKGTDFLLHPDVLLYNSYKYDQREIAIYYALAAMRNVADYYAIKKITLDTFHCPVDLDDIKNIRLLRIEDGDIHFKYEEVRKEKIH
jgi:hypothetical protein